MPEAIILDGSQRSALAVARSLGRRRIGVSLAAGYNDATIKSAYVRTALRYRNPNDDIDGFISDMMALIQMDKRQVIIPITDITTDLLVMLREAAPSTATTTELAALPDKPAYERLTDKHTLVELAQELGVPVPQSRLITSAERPSPNVAFPVVLKPTRSKYRCGNGWTATSVRIAATPQEIENILMEEPWFTQHPYMLQEYIEGEGRGIFALYNHGKPVCFFAHRRIREKPPWGGVSVLSESVAPDPVTLDYARRLLDHVGWHGVAMVEFKVAANGTPYLMEVNTRFWGSLQLAIDSGVDFPWLLYQIASGETPDAPASYKLGQRLRWFLGDLDSLYLALKDQRHFTGADKRRRVREFLTPGFRSTRHEIFRWDDPRPAWQELINYIKNVF